MTEKRARWRENAPKASPKYFTMVWKTFWWGKKMRKKKEKFSEKMSPLSPVKFAGKMV